MTASPLANERSVRTVPDRLLGFLGGAMVVLALLVLVRGGEEDTGRAPAVAAPRISIMDPEGGEVLNGPLTLVFRTDAELSRQPGGWGSGGLHLHLRVDGQEFMPGPRDIVPLANGVYRWSFGPLEPGARVLRLVWSDARHQPVAGGGSPDFKLYAR